MDEIQEEKKVISGTVKTKEAGLGKRLANLFFNTDRDSIGDYIVQDVFVPSVKDMVFNMFEGALSMMFWGSSRRGNTPGSTFHPGQRNNYSNIYKTINSPQQSAPSRSAGYSGYSCKEIFFENRIDAMTVLDQLGDIMQQYHKCTVGDLYNLIGEHTVYTDFNYGWTGIATVMIDKCKDGWKISMPPVERLQ